MKTAPPSSSATETTPISRPLTLDEAQDIIKTTPEILIHSPLIEEEAFYRLQNYPSQITASLHHSLITIPRKLAYILHTRPASIAPAVEAFYLRDPVALKPLDGCPSDLVFPPLDLVTVSARFTKVLFAQLTSQQFSPPAAWKDILPQAEAEAGSDILSQKKYSRLELGMKITSGFEMLITDPKNGDSRTVREIKILLDDLVVDDNSDLPTDDEIVKWKDVLREDNESWMDINFEDFEKELQGKNQGKKPGIPGAFGPEPPSGFGNAKTQADLKKMVERFESFLNDDTAGIDGAELDDMDFDDDEEDEEDSDEDSDDEDKDVSFDEKEFAKMMREMMGMPSEEQDEEPPKSASAKPVQDRQIEEVVSSEEEDLNEASEMRKVMEQMEAELNEAGVLNLDPTLDKLSTLKGKQKQEEKEDVEDWENESDNEDVDIDFNLAKNLLESFKSQAGMAGPGGNMLSMMGMKLPRDEDDAGPSRKAP